MSRAPMAGPIGGGAPAYRANMMRRAAPAKPAAARARPRVMKANAGGQAVRKARPVHKASLHRPARKKTPGVRRAAAAPAPAIARAYPIPTPMPVAARELAVPRAYALITTTVCENGPVAPSALETGVPVLAIAPPVGPGGGGPSGGFVPGTDTRTVLPPMIPPSPGPTGPTGGVPGTPPPTPPPEVTPPLIEPPVVGPPITEPPVTEPPITEPPTPEPQVTEPPIFPPGVEPPLGPPIVPPIIQPPTTPVPEPATWALMILGFGLLGARLRTTSSARSGSPGRAGPRR